MSGLFITMEGVEGSGKSTQIERLTGHLQKAGVPLVVSKEPGGTKLGRELRTLLLAPHASGETWCPEAELLLFYADRAQHLASLIRPALEAGKVVLVDRFEDSTWAYQGARGVSDTHLEGLRDIVLGDLKPHLTLVLDMDPRDSLKRVEARNALLGDSFKETRFDQEILSFHQKVRQRFQEIAQKDPHRVFLVPATGTPEDVDSAIWGHVADALRTRGYGVA